MRSGRGIFSLAASLFLFGSAQADIVITQLANEGVIISDGDVRIMIDGMVVEPYSVYGGLPDDAAVLFKSASGPFAGIDLALASHRHHDHNQPAYACAFLKNSTNTLFVSSSQVLDLMREKCRELVTTSPRVRVIDPQYGSPEVFEQGGAKVTVFPLSHGARKYATIQNYAHSIQISGMTVLHIGDAAMTPDDFQSEGMERLKADVALIPFWYFQPGPGAALVDQYLDAPVKIAVHIPPGEMEEVRPYMQENFPEVTILDPTLKEMVISPSGQ